MALDFFTSSPRGVSLRPGSYARNLITAGAGILGLIVAVTTANQPAIEVRDYAGRLTFQVTGSGTVHMSGSLKMPSYNCSINGNGGKLTTDSLGNVICGDDGSGAGTTSGNILTITNARFVKKQGDTMTGGLLIVSGGHAGLPVADVGVLLEIAGIGSGRIIRAQDTLASSGTLSVKGSVTLTNTVSCQVIQSDSNGTISCAGGFLATSTGSLRTAFSNQFLTSSTGALRSSLYAAGSPLSKSATGIFTLNSTITGTLLRVGTVSGSNVYTKLSLFDSGTLVVRGTTTLKQNMTLSGSESITRAVGVNTGNLLVVDNKGLVFDGTNKRVGIGKAAPLTALEAVGTISGSALTLSTLSLCTNMQTSIAGVVSCNNALYLATSTGALKTALAGQFLSSSTGALRASLYAFGSPLSKSAGVVTLNATITGTTLKVQTVSGSNTYMKFGLFASGGLVVKSSSMFQNTVSVRGTLSGYGLNIMTGNSYDLGKMVFGSTKTPVTTLEVVGSMSGGSLVVSNIPSCGYMNTSANGTAQCGTLPNRNIILSAGGGTPQTNSGSVAKNNFLTVNMVNVQTQDFTSSGGTAVPIHAVQWMAAMPVSYNGGTITFKFNWYTPNVAGNVKWFIQCMGYQDTDAVDQLWGVSGSVIDTSGTTAKQMMLSAATGNVTCGGHPAGGKPIIVRVYRMRQARDAADTLSGTASLVNVIGTFTTSSFSD